MAFSRTVSVKPRTGYARWRLGRLDLGSGVVRFTQGHTTLLSFRPSAIRAIGLTKQPWLLGIRIPMLRLELSADRVSGGPSPDGARTVTVLLAVSSPESVGRLLMREATVDTLAVSLGARIARDGRRREAATPTARETGLVRRGKGRSWGRA